MRQTRAFSGLFKLFFATSTELLPHGFIPSFSWQGEIYRDYAQEIKMLKSTRGKRTETKQIIRLIKKKWKRIDDRKWIKRRGLGVVIEQQEMEKSLLLRARARIQSRETRLDSRFSLIKKKRKKKKDTRKRETERKTKEPYRVKDRWGKKKK